MITVDNAQKTLDLLVHIQDRSDLSEYLHEDILKNASISEAHFVDYIAKHENTNATEIAQALRLTKGAISKIYKKLIAKNLICRYQDPKNAKEIFFRLTEDGTALFEQHSIIHKQVEKDWQGFFSKYSEDEQATIICFLEDIVLKLDEFQAES